MNRPKILGSSALLAILAVQAEAQSISLVIDGTPLNGVTVNSVNIQNGTLHLDTAGPTLVISLDDVVVEPEPEPEPAPEPEPEPAPEPEPDSEPGTCLDSETIVCGYHISPAEYSKGSRGVRLTIPQGKTLVSSFVTGSNAAFSASFNFQSVISKPNTRYWISTTPNGPRVGYCGSSGSFLYSLETYQRVFMPWTCNLQPSTTYYLNLKFESATHAAGITQRDINVHGTP